MKTVRVPGHARNGYIEESAARGTRPEGARDEREASRQVQEMFSRIAPRYDFLNHLLSLSLDRLWRRRTARKFLHVLRRPNARVLDLCCGTGDLALALARARRSPGGASFPVLGADFALPMLKRALEKSRRQASGVAYLAADALALPFADGSFDLVTAAFGFRNLANYERGLKEIARALRSGGEVGILEFNDRRSAFLAPIYRLYFQKILPRIGGAISGSSAAYFYLPSSVAEFLPVEELQKWMERAGFTAVESETWSCAIVALHRGTKK